MLLEYQTGIDIPKIDGRNNRKRKYPWLQMPIGASLFIPGKKEGRSATASAFAVRKKYGLNFTSRTVSENGIIGVRIWRVE